MQAILFISLLASQVPVFHRVHQISPKAVEPIVDRSIGGPAAFFDFDNDKVYLTSSRALLVLDGRGTDVFRDTLGPGWDPTQGIGFHPGFSTLPHRRRLKYVPSNGLDTNLDLGLVARDSVIAVLGERYRWRRPDGRYDPVLAGLRMVSTVSREEDPRGLRLSGKSHWTSIAVVQIAKPPCLVLCETRPTDWSPVRLVVLSIGKRDIKQVAKGQWPKTLGRLDSSLATLGRRLRAQRGNYLGLYQVDPLSGRALIRRFGRDYERWLEFDPATGKIAVLQNAGGAKGMLPYYCRGHLFATSSGSLSSYYADAGKGKGVNFYGYSRRERKWVLFGPEMPLGFDLSGNKCVIRDMVSGEFWICRFNQDVLKSLD